MEKRASAKFYKIDRDSGILVFLKEDVSIGSQQQIKIGYKTKTVDAELYEGTIFFKKTSDTPDDGAEVTVIWKYHPN